MSKVGLQNLGNTCFFNSCIQILSMIPLFQEKAEDWRNLIASDVTKLRSRNAHYDADYQVMEAWLNLQEIMIYASSSSSSTAPGGIGGGGGALAPRQLLSMIHRNSKAKQVPIFSGYDQNDVTEFLQFFMEALHGAIRRPVKIKIHGTPTASTDHLAVQCYTTMIQEWYAKEYSECLQWFYGVYASQIMSSSSSSSLSESTTTTTNNILSTKTEPFFVLHLPIVSLQRDPWTRSDVVTLEQCFDMFVSEEYLEDGWYNEETKRKEYPVKKKISFWNFPPILVIALKRFQGNGTKNNASVEYPLDLNLSKYVIGYRAHEYQYELFGVCNHFGNVGGGHYTALAKHSGDGRWRYYNDGVVDEVKGPDCVPLSAAYCLFYKKKI